MSAPKPNTNKVGYVVVRHIDPEDPSKYDPISPPLLSYDSALTCKQLAEAQGWKVSIIEKHAKGSDK